ncbi:reverse transcriptase domain-containing protein [Tanacetum coccineum]|uniref:Reverse transcriptase domain-containing protein n=1 Tax=Tanacetum coccineum TaxID=301880 RepID=A0ABQ4Z5N1_9ASTR
MKRGQAPERAKAILEEVHKLVEADTLQVLLDAYKGYHQIQMAKDDEEKTAFHTSQGVYCYTKMPFGLKNAGATYCQQTSHFLVQKHLDVLRRRETSVWTTGARRTFTQFKSAYSSLTHAVAPRPGEELIMYLSADAWGTLAPCYGQDRDSSNTVILVISKPDASGRLQKWSVLLGEHNISYRPRTAVKGQILADFLIEKPETDAVLPQSEVKLQEPWILFTDGSSCVDGSGAGLILTNPEGMEFTYALRFEFTATNNEAEYEALIAGLRIAARMGVRNLEANVDSRLVANHVLGEYVAKEDNMIQYLRQRPSAIQA